MPPHWWVWRGSWDHLENVILVESSWLQYLEIGSDICSQNRYGEDCSRSVCTMFLIICRCGEHKKKKVFRTLRLQGCVCFHWHLHAGILRESMKQWERLKENINVIQHLSSFINWSYFLMGWVERGRRPLQIQAYLWNRLGAEKLLSLLPACRKIWWSTGGTCAIPCSNDSLQWLVGKLLRARASELIHQQMRADR